MLIEQAQWLRQGSHDDSPQASEGGLFPSESGHVRPADDQGKHDSQEMAGSVRTRGRHEKGQNVLPLLGENQRSHSIHAESIHVGAERRGIIVSDEGHADVVPPGYFLMQCLVQSAEEPAAARGLRNSGRMFQARDRNSCSRFVMRRGESVQWTFIGHFEIRKYLKNGESAGIRTQDPRLKRAMLYQLSYRLSQTQRRHIVTRGAGRRGIIPLTGDGSLR